MVKYKLSYLNLRARGEVSRMLFHLGGQEYEDYRFDLPELKNEKPNSPFGQFPVLEVDGVKFCQSHSINRYLANQFGYAGKTPLDKLRADMIVDCAEDVLKPFFPTVFGEKGFEIQEDKKKQYEQEKLPGMLDKLEAILIQNNGGDGFFVGDDLTWADLSVCVFVRFLQSWEITIDLGRTAKLGALIDRVENYPQIKEWRENHNFSPVPLEVFRALYGKK